MCQVSTSLSAHARAPAQAHIPSSAPQAAECALPTCDARHAPTDPCRSACIPAFLRVSGVRAIGCLPKSDAQWRANGTRLLNIVGAGAAPASRGWHPGRTPVQGTRSRIDHLSCRPVARRQRRPANGSDGTLAVARLAVILPLTQWLPADFLQGCTEFAYSFVHRFALPSAAVTLEPARTAFSPARAKYSG